MRDANSPKEITLIAAASENNVLGKDNKLIWHISDDLKRFKKLTLGHSLIMGRKTFESLPKALPNRKNIVLTRNKNYKAKDAIVAHDLKKAIEFTGEDSNPYIIGGGEIYKLGLDFIDKLYITEIKANIDGDTFFPKWDKKKWKEVSRIKHPSDDKHIYEFDYVIYKRSL